MIVIACPDASTEERLRRIDALDLEPIAYKLMHAEFGEVVLSLAEADQAVALYRRFLKLCVLYPGARIVPTTQLDRVWHAHVLDTAKYRADCDHVFGHFMDHSPTPGCGEKTTDGPGAMTSRGPAACSLSTSVQRSASSRRPAPAATTAAVRSAAPAASRPRRPKSAPGRNATCPLDGLARPDRQRESPAGGKR